MASKDGVSSSHVEEEDQEYLAMNEFLRVTEGMLYEKMWRYLGDENWENVANVLRALRWLQLI